MTKVVFKVYESYVNFKKHIFTYVWIKLSNKNVYPLKFHKTKYINTDQLLTCNFDFSFRNIIFFKTNT